MPRLFQNPLAPVEKSESGVATTSPVTFTYTEVVVPSGRGTTSRPDVVGANGRVPLEI